MLEKLENKIDIFKEDNRQTDEKIDSINENSRRLENKIDSINENSRKQNEILSENLIKLMNEKFDKNKEETDENNRCLLYTSRCV